MDRQTETQTDKKIEGDMACGLCYDPWSQRLGEGKSTEGKRREEKRRRGSTDNGKGEGLVQR